MKGKRYLLFGIFAVGYVLSFILNESVRNFHPVHFILGAIIVASCVGLLCEAVTRESK